jgi:hypothetical protein
MDAWVSALFDALQHAEWFRAGMLLWAAGFTVASSGITGYRVDLFLTRQWRADPPPWYPPDGATWAGLGVGVLVTACSTFGF